MTYQLAPKLAVQMYTVRDQIQTSGGFLQTTKKLNQIGYRAVQLSAVGCMNDGSLSTIDAHQILRDNELRCIATHRNWIDLAEKTESEIEFHKTLECDYVAIGGLPKAYEEAGYDGYKKFLDDSAPVIATLKEAGIQFGYHNHSHEFRKDNGVVLYDLFVNHTDPDFLLEVDTYWVWHAGVDPVSLFERIKGRVPVIHHKDKEVIAGEGPVISAIGEGNLPWETIIPACEDAGTQWHCVEQDTCRRDPFDCLKSSFEFLK
jgi:sugar phosphate isomerase/epimerase